MKRPWFFIPVVVSLSARQAFAGDMPGLDLRSGAPHELLGKVMGHAYWLLVCALVVALVLEGLMRPPGRDRDLSGVGFRFLMMLVFLKAYPIICGTVVNTADAIADAIAPRATWERYAQMRETYFTSIYDTQPGTAAQPTSDGSLLSRTSALLDGVASGSKFVGAYFGGALFDGLLALMIALGQACQWVFAQLSQVILAFFFVVGPLAIACNVPLGVNSAGRWFQNFVTVACWPVGSALLLALSTDLMFQGHASLEKGSTATAWGALASTLLIVVLNLCVPLLCSAIVGGAIRNIVTPALGGATAGALAAMSWAKSSADSLRGRDGASTQGAARSFQNGAETSTEPSSNAPPSIQPPSAQRGGDDASRKSSEAQTPTPIAPYEGPPRRAKVITALPRALRNLPRPRMSGPARPPPPPPETANDRPRPPGDENARVSKTFIPSGK